MQNFVRLERLVRPQTHRPNRLHRAHCVSKNPHPRQSPSRARFTSSISRARSPTTASSSRNPTPNASDPRRDERYVVSDNDASASVFVVAARVARHARPLFAIKTFRIDRAPPRERTYASYAASRSSRGLARTRPRSIERRGSRSRAPPASASRMSARPFVRAVRAARDRRRRGPSTRRGVSARVGETARRARATTRRAKHPGVWIFRSFDARARATQGDAARWARRRARCAMRRRAKRSV